MARKRDLSNVVYARKTAAIDVPIWSTLSFKDHRHLARGQRLLDLFIRNIMASIVWVAPLACCKLYKSFE